MVVAWSQGDHYQRHISLFFFCTWTPPPTPYVIRHSSRYQPTSHLVRLLFIKGSNYCSLIDAPSLQTVTCDCPARGRGPPAIRASLLPPRCYSEPRTPPSLRGRTASQAGGDRRVAGRTETDQPYHPSFEPSCAYSHRKIALPTVSTLRTYSVAKNTQTSRRTHGRERA